MSLLLIMVLIGTLLSACGGSNTATNPPKEEPTPSENTSQTEPAKENTTKTPKDGGTLTMGTFSDIVTVNPVFQSDTSSGDVSKLILAQLYNLDREANVVAEPWSLAAEPPQISEDGKTYTVKLKPEAKWTDGTPVTADDIIFTINATRNPEVGSPGISAYDKVDSIEKVDEHTAKIQLKQVYAPFIYSLILTLAPSHILKDVPPKELKQHAYGTDPAKTVTNGPWKWSEWKQKQHISVDADPNYWGAKKPHIAKVIYKIYADQNTEVQALIKGDVDTVSAIPVTQLAAVEKRDNLRVVLAPGPSYEYLGFNFDPKNFPDNFSLFEGQKTRQAIAHALNRLGMVDNVLKGTGKLMNAPFLPGSWADPGEAAVNYNYDAEKAKQLLAEDGWTLGSDGILTKDGKRFSFELQYNAGNSRREQISSIVQQNLKDVGIEVKTKGIDFAAWVDQHLNTGKYQAILMAWSLTDPDPNGESTFSSKYYPPAGQNSGWYKNEKLDELWVKGYSVVEQSERKKIYEEVGKEISTDLPYIFMYQYGTPQGIGPRVNFAEEDKPEPSLAYGYMYRMINWWVE
ncbi:ABC transporter substrate-binding protein [Paenibacillus profundus]|uniref:ABC transporter substrate-binding protein n=1 Tax=Paenibacillus profundus TaxID=1173085 RepID=A0ABS8YCN8_9BACL|nr:ABC transporter substrate-binding protein [Paenibacillus profundus]MCE5168989.1 ABC transporter substrate-binding protein [Paenibacillus profundus]